MGNKNLVYKQKLENVLDESFTHLNRLKNAFMELSKKYSLPLNIENYEKINSNIYDLALCDQIIYRFSKLQDTLGARLFKALLLFEGEDVKKPFLDILNRLEEMDIIDVDEWFELRELRNQIAHEYENNEEIAIKIINLIYENLIEFEDILRKIQKLKG